jgi:hypothetical protein
MVVGFVHLRGVEIAWGKRTDDRARLEVVSFLRWFDRLCVMDGLRVVDLRGLTRRS